MVAVVIPSIRYINNNLFFIFIASLLSPEPMVLPITTEEALATPSIKDVDIW